VIEFPQPRAADLDSLLVPVLVDLASERGLDLRWFTSLTVAEHELARRHWRGGSVRRLRRVVEAILDMRERSGLRH
jgi:hypothetical protein